jgi:hypothetical protein
MAVYRSAMGKQVDMAAMVSRNEKVRAVGNMNVNARGDIVDSNNRIIKEGNKRVTNSYNKTVTPNVPKPVVDKSQLTKEEQMFEDNDEDIVK